MLINTVLFVLSLIGVAKSADMFLYAAERIGVRLRLPSFILGVLLVGFGTSLPELSTSIAAVLDQNHEVALANVIGSNIANVLLIIGVATFLLGTLTFEKDLIDLDLPHPRRLGILTPLFTSNR